MITGTFDAVGQRWKGRHHRDVLTMVRVQQDVDGVVLLFNVEMIVGWSQGND